MREIKFRGKSFADYKWHYGDLIQMDNGDTYIHETIQGCRSSHMINPNTVGQYTGLKDKNDKEIYEGDIIKEFDSDGDPWSLSAVEWGEHLGVGWCLKGIKSFCEYDKRVYDVDLESSVVCKSEIVGNIYDNPELINKEE